MGRKNRTNPLLCSDVPVDVPVIIGEESQNVMVDNVVFDDEIENFSTQTEFVDVLEDVDFSCVYSGKFVEFDEIIRSQAYYNYMRKSILEYTEFSKEDILISQEEKEKEENDKDKNTDKEVEETTEEFRWKEVKKNTQKPVSFSDIQKETNEADNWNKVSTGKKKRKVLAESVVFDVDLPKRPSMKNQQQQNTKKTNNDGWQTTKKSKKKISFDNNCKKKSSSLF